MFPHPGSPYEGGKRMKVWFVSITLLAVLAGSILFTRRPAHAAAAPAWLIDKPGAYTLDHDIMATAGQCARGHCPEQHHDVAQYRYLQPGKRLDRLPLRGEHNHRRPHRRE